MLSQSSLQTIVLTTQIEKAEAFYRDVLGLAVRSQSHGALVFDVGGSNLLVSPVPSTQPSEHTVLGFSVTNVDAVMKRLHQQGISFERFDGFAHDAAGALVTPEGAKVAWFRDPDGNLLSIVQYAA